MRQQASLPPQAAGAHDRGPNPPCAPGEEGLRNGLKWQPSAQTVTWRLSPGA